MFNPFEYMQKMRSRLTKPIRPVIELQKDCSLVNIVTNSIQDGCVVRDLTHDETWLLDPQAHVVAIYLDGVFKGMGHFASEEGVIVDLKKEIELQREITVTSQDGTTETRTVPGYRLIYKGLFSKLLDAKIIEIGSALKLSWGQTMIYLVLIGALAFMMGMSYGA